MNYYRQIDRSKIQFDFVYFKEVESDFKDEITSLGGRYFKFTEPSFDFSYKKEAEKFFVEHKGEYSAIHCHALFAAAFYGKIANKYGIRNVIVHSHSTSYGIGMIRRIRNFYFIKRAKIVATHRLACSEETARFMFGNKAFESGKASIISNAIDCKKYVFDEGIRKDIRQELGINDELVLGHVGVFSAQKNHTFIIEVFNEVHKKNPDSILLLVGTDGIAFGSTKNLVEQKVKKLGLENCVRFLDVRSDVNHILMAMDFFVFPSLFEGFGISLIEAQITGLPCLVSENIVEAIKVSNSVATLQLSDGVGKWADYICNLNLNTNRKLGTELFENFDISKQSEKLESIYFSLNI